MKLTKRVDYSIRVLVHTNAQQEPISMPALAQAINISYHNVMKLVQLLVKEGVLATKQGKHGGVFLVKDLAKISLRQVIEWVEGPIFLSDCFHADCSCEFLPACQIKHVFSDVQIRMNAVLESVTMLDMVKEIT